MNLKFQYIHLDFDYRLYKKIIKTWYSNYANLCKDESTKDVYNEILKEWKLTKQVVLDISEHKEFLEDNTYLTKSLENRLQYFNTLNLLQIELIRRAREEETLESQINTIHITINGVATGLRNSG